jgi:hypothetical protein
MRPSEDHPEPDLGHQMGDPATLVLLEGDEVEVAELGALDPLEGEHALARVCPVDLGDGDLLGALEDAAEDVGVPGLGAVVELAGDGASELVDELDGVDELQLADAALDDAGDASEQLDVGLDLTAGVGTLHLDGHLAAGVQLGEVHLADGRGGDGLGVELGEQLVDGALQLSADDLLDLLVGKGRDGVLEEAELGDHLGRDHVRADGEQLAELDEGRAELVEHLAHVAATGGHGHVDRIVLAARTPLEGVAEAVPRGHVRDLAQTGGLGTPAHAGCHAEIVSRRGRFRRCATVRAARGARGWSSGTRLRP